jgi:hypothetical protein
MNKLISSNEFSKIVKNASNKVITYPELEQYKSFNDFLPNNIDYIILLIETEQNTGHYTCLTKRNNLITFFDSYGLKPDSEFNFISQHIQTILGENYHILTDFINLWKRQGNKFEYNNIDFQEFKQGVNTCGRYSILFINLFLKGYNLKDFQKLLINLKNKSKFTYDQIIVELTKKLN